jgi:hypothetical protein
LTSAEAKFSTGVVDTGGKLAAGIVGNGGEFTTGTVDTDAAP